jgi:hypothetical protein
VAARVAVRSPSWNATPWLAVEKEAKVELVPTPEWVGYPRLDLVFVARNHGELPVRARSGGELAERVRRAEDYAILGARVVVELHSESNAAKPSARAWAIARRADRGRRKLTMTGRQPSAAARERSAD